MDKIIIKGARENNLKNIDLELPKNKLIVMTGVSGSGKSSLIMSTLAPAAREYIYKSKVTIGKNKKIEGRSILSSESLLGALKQMDVQNLPFKDGSFDVMFYLDFSGRIDDPSVKALMNDLVENLEYFRFLGTFKSE